MKTEESFKNEVNYPLFLNENFSSYEVGLEWIENYENTPYSSFAPFQSTGQNLE